MLENGTIIEFHSGLQYKIVKYISEDVYDLQAIKAPYSHLPDYFPIFTSVKINHYKIINK